MTGILDVVLRPCVALVLGSLFASPVVAQQQAAPQRAGMHATFAEEFTRFAATPSGFLDGQPVWRNTYIGGDRTLPNNREAQWYVDHAPDGPFRLRDGVLEITAAPAPGLPQGMTHRSGMIMGQRLLNQQYGYFEIRAQLPRGRGLWPAFWLLPSDGHWPPEIDIMEMLGHQHRTYYVALHARPDGVPLDEVTAVQTADLTAGFHTFGVSWRPDRIRYYLDDRLVHDVPTPSDLHRPMYMLANLAVGGAGSWPGAAARDLTGVYRIDWIRAWQFDDLRAGGGR